MIEQIQNSIYTLAPYFPLGVIGLWRWSVWITKKVVARNYKHTAPNDYTDTLSIVTPVYNEDPNFFKKALKSWADNKPDEIIAVIDHTDESSIKIFKKFQEKNSIGKLIITQKPGKRAALADGIRASKYNLVALIDSDTFWDPNIKDDLIFPFKDPTVGGVGPRQDVLDANTLSRKLFNIHIDHRYFDEITYLATVGDAITCLSGRTAVYRSKIIKDLLEDLENETFMGAKCISGDDKCLTRLVQEQGWKTRYQGNIKVLTPGAPDLLSLFKQHIRWTRNSYRSDIKSLMGKWIWKREKFLVYHMIDRFTQPFTLILGPIYLVLSIYWGHWWVAVTLVLWWHLSRGIKLYPHFRQHPSDLQILPFYIFTTYFLGVLKIYSMVTIGQQGWITRWDKDRLKSSSGRLLMILKSTAPYVATLSIILILGYGVTGYKNINAKDRNSIVVVNSESTIKPSINDILIPFNNKIDPLVLQHKEDILDNMGKEGGLYTIKKGDTFSEIALAYKSDLSNLVRANKNIINNPNQIEIGQKIIIPISELRNSVGNYSLSSNKTLNVSFDEAQNTISVLGFGNIVNLSDIKNLIDDDFLLEEGLNKEWILRSNLFIGEGVTLVLDGKDVSWLKLKSDKGYFTSIDSKNGNIIIKNTKITSWDEFYKSFDLDHKDGRSFIRVLNDSRMDIIDSEIAFLGFGDEYEGDKIKGGGFYGVSWKIPGGTFDQYLVTGSVINSVFHDNYFGAYTFGATGMVFKSNIFYNNVKYGFDFHDESNNFLVEDNIVRNNGSHGIILSDKVYNNIIRGNASYNNALHGIMLHQSSNNNLLEDNNVYENTDGIVAYDSHNNLILNNNIRKNKNGIRINVNSSGNYIEGNHIIENKNGVFIYNDAKNNFVLENSIEDNIRKIYIKDADGNLIE